MSSVVRVVDLAEPRLTSRQVELQALAEQMPVTFTVDAVLDAARQRSGLDDFGPSDFEARLSLLCRSVDDDTTLLASGRIGVWSDLVRYASNRLLLHDTFERHPEIDEVPLAPPIVVAGLPRSGTTHLLNLLAADTRLRSLPYWEACEPVRRVDDPELVPGEDPRFTRRAREWDQTDELLPLLKAMHAMTPDHIHEELELMGPDFASYNFEWRWHAPAWRDHYLAHDQSPHYAYMRRVLQLLTWQDQRAGRPPRDRWVLKCPQHLEQLTVLHATFPEATILMTHRDPVSVIASAATMAAYGDRMRRSPVDPPRTGQYWADRIEIMLGACVRDRGVVPDDRVLDIAFDRFMADDQAVVESAYARADLPMTDTARGELAAYRDAHPRGRHGRLAYDLEGDFGIDPDGLGDDFSFYFDRFGISPEGIGG